MEEQSHKQEMAAALRGDFERLRARRERTRSLRRGTAPVDHHRPSPTLVVRLLPLGRLNTLVRRIGSLGR